MKIITKHILIIISVVLTGITQGSESDSLFLKGNEFYDRELYNDAIEQYNIIIQSGYESTEVYYNMGNAYFKLNDIPHAILFYEKAKKLASHNEQIDFNLKVANTKIADKIEPVPELFFRAWWRNLYTSESSNTWAITGVFLFMLFFVCIAFYLLSQYLILRKTSFYAGIVTFFLSIVILLMAYRKYDTEKNLNQAIVFTPTVTIKSSPRENSVDLFVIHEGTKVTIVDEFSGWYEIKIASGSIGWLQVSAVQKI
ncbi:MAG: tetratricopeptide repeat protein [Bacteroidales bacterium]|nr:tetratricopeptide repeat protein [Bacteroidales bacterium]